jgi:hypothetical protein
MTASRNISGDQHGSVSDDAGQLETARDGDVDPGTSSGAVTVNEIPQAGSSKTGSHRLGTRSEPRGHTHGLPSGGDARTAINPLANEVQFSSSHKSVTLLKGQPHPSELRRSHQTTLALTEVIDASWLPWTHHLHNVVNTMRYQEIGSYPVLVPGSQGGCY